MIAYPSRFRHDEEDEEDEAARRPTWEKEGTEEMGRIGSCIYVSESLQVKSGEWPCFDI